MPLILAIFQLFGNSGSYDLCYVLRAAPFFAVLGLYWLWLSSPPAGAARFEALITKNAVWAVPLALIVGDLVAIAVLH